MPAEAIGRTAETTADSGVKATVLKSNWRSTPSWILRTSARRKAEAESKPAGYGKDC
jgi:hypothetical protein